MRLAGTWAMMAVVCMSDRASLTGRPEDDCQTLRPVLCCHIFLPCLRCFCLRRVLKSLRSCELSGCCCPIGGCQRNWLRDRPLRPQQMQYYTLSSNKHMINGELYYINSDKSIWHMHKHFLIIVSQKIPRIVSVLDADWSTFEIKDTNVRDIIAISLLFSLTWSTKQLNRLKNNK